jgi:16S rRNA (guanine1207-N2)-methyltransferase
MEPDYHYFSAEAPLTSEPVEIALAIGELELTLFSDTGVFSKDRVDRGTLLLARTAKLPTEGTILDLGCGYGTLGIVAAMLNPQARVTYVDVNPRAVELARKNCERHQLANVELLTGDALEVLGDRTYDAILCNPPYRMGKAPVMALLSDAARRLRPGGALWIVGRTKLGVKTLARDLGALFASVKTADIKGGYRVIVSRHEAAQA